MGQRDKTTKVHIYRNAAIYEAVHAGIFVLNCLVAKLAVSEENAMSENSLCDNNCPICIYVFVKLKIKIPDHISLL